MIPVQMVLYQNFTLKVHIYSWFIDYVNSFLIVYLRNKEMLERTMSVMASSRGQLCNLYFRLDTTWHIPYIFENICVSRISLQFK
jgi:hypothetical protein